MKQKPESKDRFRRLLACQECKRQWDVTQYEVGQKLRCTCGFLLEVVRMQPRAPEVQHCESCGALRKRSKVACEYCGAVPTLVASKMGLVCPFCFCRTADDSKYCQSCGNVIQPGTLDAATGRLRCPRCCKAALANRQIGAFTVEECPACGGMWIAQETFERIVNQQVEQREEKEYAHTVKVFGELSEVQYVKCPECMRHMNRHNFARASGVIIDECRQCGIWLDHDELEKIAAYVATGGLRRTKQIELRDMEEKAQRLRAQIAARSSAGSDLGLPILAQTRTPADAVVITDVSGSVLDAIAGLFGRLR
ncbi:MAG: zf-TFIIB domain-containing protein [Acidobacteriota bacterium]